MILKYFLLTTVVVFQIALTVHTWRESSHTKILQLIFDSHDRNDVFTEKGKPEILKSFGCLNRDARQYFSLQGENINGDSVCMKVLQKLFRSYPIHLLKTSKNENDVEIELLFNLPKPITIAIHIVHAKGHYKIASIKNLCELFERVNLYFESVRETSNEKI